MNDRDIETEIKAFFRRTATPEPSAHLRMAVVDSRLDAPTPRRMLLTARKTAFSLLGLAATVIIAVGLLLVAIRGGSTGPANVGTTPVQSPSTSAGSQGPANVGPATTVTWQTGDLSLPTAFPIEQLVPIGDRLYLIASDNGSAAGPTAKPSGGIWATADGLG